MPLTNSPERVHRVSMPVALLLAFGLFCALARDPVAATTGDSVLGDEPLPPVSFERQVRPLLADACFRCHGPDHGARKAKLRLDKRSGAMAVRGSDPGVIVPGNAAASALVERITTDDIFDRMPPTKARRALDDEEIALLRRWIDEGAVYDQHWAWVPPQPQTAPDVGSSSWPRGELDHFVLARLQAENLDPSPSADRPTLLRRLSLDLTGLPPSPDEVDSYLADTSPGAYERCVERLLASPHFGERWARWWLDFARYADTKGYEQDGERTIWPYRDWVIRAFNDDLPFDRFTFAQIAGDLGVDPSPDQLVATAFHRNTMTNDEGGTDNEEFRAAAVVDRVNTTMTTWMALTAGCAQCHSHKFDPLSQNEYFGLYAFFNDTADTDAIDERPLLKLPSEAQARELDELDVQRAALDAERDALMATLSDVGRPDRDAELPDNHATNDQPRPWNRLFVDDELPAGAIMQTSGGVDDWGWQEHDPASGLSSWRVVAAADAVEQVFFTGASYPLDVQDEDTLFVDLRLDPEDPPRQVMLQFHSEEGWEHRAFWGDDVITWGTLDTGSRRRLGDLPATGEWVRLSIPAAEVALAAPIEVDGWAFSQVGGTVHWDRAGILTTAEQDPAWRHSQPAWERRMLGRSLPDDTLSSALATPAGERSEEQREALRAHFLQSVCAETSGLFEDVNTRATELETRLSALQAALIEIPIMRELAADERRVTRLHVRGNFLDQGEVVTAGVPEALHPLDDTLPRDRSGLAAWLVDPANPLTARCQVNRVWEQLFGIGLVETVEDFGVQGERPSHPALLDWLAVTFRDEGWSFKDLCRRIVTSATYRQTSNVGTELLKRDPNNRLLARGPRFRLAAEMVRDQALAVSGLLDPTLYGPPVFPPQPDGIWQIVYNDSRWVESEGGDAHRRALYTFWRRTSPYPSMLMFDAPTRDLCSARRLRTNTPLQALVTLNDPVFVEAAQGLARRTLREAPAEAADRVRHAFRLALARLPTHEELQVLLDVHADEQAHYSTRPDEALALATDPIGSAPAGSDVTQLAAWTVVAHVILNLDELLIRP